MEEKIAKLVLEDETFRGKILEMLGEEEMKKIKRQALDKQKKYSKDYKMKAPSIKCSDCNIEYNRSRQYEHLRSKPHKEAIGTYVRPTWERKIKMN